MARMVYLGTHQLLNLSGKLSIEEFSVVITNNFMLLTVEIHVFKHLETEPQNLVTLCNTEWNQ